MNLVHRVGVIFHGNDRLTRHMQRVGDKFIALESKQKAWEQAQKKAGATEAQLEKLRERHAAKREADLTRWMQMQKTASAARNKFAMNEQRLQAEMQAGWDRYYARSAAQRNEQIALWEKHNRAREAKELSHLKRMEAMNATHAATTARMQTALAKDHARRDLLTKKNNTLLSEGEVSNVAQRITENKARRDRLAKLRADAMRQSAFDENGEGLTVGKGKKRRPLTDDEKDQLAAQAARPYNKQISQIEKALALDEKRLTQHAQLVALNDKIAQQERAILAEKDRQRVATQKLASEQAAAIQELKRLQRQQYDAKMKGDNDELLRLERLHATKMANLEQQSAAQKAQLMQMEEINARQLKALETEHVARQRLILDTERQVAAENAATAAAERRALVAQRMQAWWGGSAAAMGAGAGTAMTGGMILGGVGYAGHRLSHSAAELEIQKQNLRNALRGKEHERAAETLIAQIEASDTRIPGGVRMSTKEQLEIVQDLVSSGIDWRMAGQTVAPMAQVIALARTRGRDMNKAPQHFALIQERLGLVDPMEVTRFYEEYAKATAVSQRLTPKYLAEFAVQASPISRLMGIDMTQMADYDFLAAADPAGGTMGRQITNALTALARGGTNARSTAMLQALADGGYFKEGVEARPARFKDVNGKWRDVLDENGDPVKMKGSFSFGHRGYMESFGILRDAMLQANNIDKDKWKKNELTQRERSTLAQFASTVFNAKTGTQFFNLLLDPVQIARYEKEQELQRKAPGLMEQLGTFDNKYGMRTQRFAVAMAELGTELGDQLLTPMGKLVTQLTEMADAARAFIKDNPKFVPMLLDGAMALGKWTLALGAAKIAFGALNFMLLGMPKMLTDKLGAAVVAKVAEKWAARGAARVATTVAGEGLGALLARTGAVTRVPNKGFAGLMSGLANAVKAGGTKVIGAMRGVMLALASPHGAVVLGGLALGAAIGTAIQRGLEHFGLAEKFQQYLASKLPAWLGGHDAEAAAKLRQEQEAKLFAKTGLTAQQYDAYSQKRSEALAAGRAYHSPQQEAAMLAGKGPMTQEAAARVVTAQSSHAPGNAAVQQALNPMGGYTLGRQDKLVIEFQGQPPPGVDPRRIEREIVQQATRGGIGSRQMPGPLPSGIAGAY